MIGLPNFDLTNANGKQKFVEYIVGLMRNEIVAFTSSYNDFGNSVNADSPDGLLVNNHRIGLDANKPRAGDVNIGTYYTSTDIALGTTYRSDGIAWTQVAGAVAGGITVSDTAPTGAPGSLWYDSTTGKTYLYFDSFWVEVGNTGAVDITADTIIPAGMIMPTAGSVEPSGWLYCYGQNLSRSTYARLFTAVGTTYGVGDGSTTFGLPDLRGRTIAGRDNMGGTAASRLTAAVSGITATTLGNAGGNQALHSHTHTQDSHNHTQNAHSHLTFDRNTVFSGIAGGSSAPGLIEAGSRMSVVATTATNIAATATNQNTGAGASQNVQPTIILNYLIKT